MKSYICRIESNGCYVYNKNFTQILCYPSLDEVFKKYKKESIKLINNTETIHAFSFPFKIFLDISNYCNLHCRHCLSQSTPECSEFLSESIVKKIADECSKYGVFQIKIGGGEPLLYPDFWNIISYIRKIMPQIRISFTTNGTSLTKKDIMNIKKMECDISVSMDGTEMIHNLIRNGNIYNKVDCTISTLLDNGITPVIRYTLMDDNIECFMDVYDYCKKRKMVLKVRRYKCTSSNERKLLTYQRDYFELVNAISNLPYCDVEDIMRKSFKKNKELYCSYDCGAAFRSLHIDCFGNISPCVFLGDEFKIGNIKKHGIKFLWDNAEILKKIRLRGDSAECMHCARKMICHGECLGLKKYYSSGNDTYEPGCMLRSLNGVDII